MEEYYPIILSPTSKPMDPHITKNGKIQRVGASEMGKRIRRTAFSA